MKVCIVIPAGRRKFLRLLVPQILAQGGWDELHVWVNTGDLDDYNWISCLPEIDSRIILKPLPAGHAPTARALPYFWRYCQDADSIYVRFDDDIVFIEKGAIEKLVRARIENPDPYLVFPVIVNNGVIAHYLEKNNKLTHPNGPGSQFTPYVFDPLVWDGAIPRGVHEQFLEKVSTDNSADFFHIDSMELSPMHISINSMAYFGKDIAKWAGDFEQAGEEAFITTTIPFRETRPLLVVGDTVVTHYSFHTQIKKLEEIAGEQIYLGYERLLKNYYNILPLNEVNPQLEEYD